MPDKNSKRLAETANRLYWGTSRPAGQLAEELGISRSKFYALIEPLELGQDCPACTGAVTFSSRTDREAGRGRCSDCGELMDITAEAAAPAADPTRPAPRTAADSHDLPGPLQICIDTCRAAWQGENRQLWVSAAIGAAVGIWVTSWLRRR